MRQSKQARIDELERCLRFEQEGLLAERANLNRLVEVHKSQLYGAIGERDHFKLKADMAERLLKIVETLSTRKP